MEDYNMQWGVNNCFTLAPTPPITPLTMSTNTLQVTEETEYLGITITVDGFANTKMKARVCKGQKILENRIESA